MFHEQWKEGTIIRLCKGKGKKCKCSNERGITVSSNIGKLFERIINNRIQTNIDITPNHKAWNKAKITNHGITRPIQIRGILIYNDPQTMQEMLNITHNIANRYRIKLGTEKSKILICGKSKT